ncbi:XRE family transcriptional regulator [Streptomyces sp. NPDC051546]|uniref:XRE family transcriptional regulator n=1 Tax=Streptomyces sp. NPDC051546 TaxID=3365655 RepID=UPI0037BBA67E
MQEQEQVTIPERILRDPRMIEACKSRDFTALFTIVRRAGIYPSQIATACRMTPSRVGEIIAGRRAIEKMDLIERIADGLRIPGSLLGLADRPWEVASEPAPRLGRRNGPARSPDRAPAPVRTLPRSPEEHPDETDGDQHALQRELAMATAADTSVAELFVTQVEGVRQLDRRFGAAQLLPGLESQIGHMESLLHFSAAPGARAAVAAALTEAATLAGWQALDLGKYRKSWRLHETAKAAAREAGAPALLAHATAQQAYVLLDLGRPREAVQQVEYARSEAGGWLPPLMDTWMHAAQAEAHAAGDEDAACRAALDRAAAARPRDPADPALPFLFLGGSHLDRWRGNCLASLGADEALQDLTAALDAMDGFNRAEAGVRCDLAVVLQRRGELDEAYRQASLAQELALVTHSERQRRRIERILETV